MSKTKRKFKIMDKRKNKVNTFRALRLNLDGDDIEDKDSDKGSSDKKSSKNGSSEK